MQKISALFGDQVRFLSLPSPRTFLLPGIRWGAAWEIFTPAFWVAQTWQFEFSNSRYEHRLGTTLAEEIGACLLGSHGSPAEVGLAAFHRLRDSELLRPGLSDLDKIYRALSHPLDLHGKTVRYRFAQRKAEYIANAMLALERLELSVERDAGRLRDWLCELRGIGSKTASWIVRNWLGSDTVAIIDIHLHRAGLLAGFFSPDDRIARDYKAMESRYLAFASAASVRAAQLDAVIWAQMRKMGRFSMDTIRKRWPSMELESQDTRA